MFVTFSLVTREQDCNTKMYFWPSIKRAVYAEIVGIPVFFFLFSSNWVSTVCQWLHRNDLLIKTLFYQIRFVFSFHLTFFFVNCKTFLQMQSEKWRRKENENANTRKSHQKVSFKSSSNFIFVKIHVEFPFGVWTVCFLGFCCCYSFH